MPNKTTLPHSPCVCVCLCFISLSLQATPVSSPKTNNLNEYYKSLRNNVITLLEQSRLPNGSVTTAKKIDQENIDVYLSKLQSLSDGSYPERTRPNVWKLSQQLPLTLCQQNTKIGRTFLFSLHFFFIFFIWGYNRNKRNEWTKEKFLFFFFLENQKK